MVIKKYAQVTHKVSEDLADIVLRASKNTVNGNYAVYISEQETLIAELNPMDNQKLLRYGYKQLLVTTELTDLVRGARDLQFKTKLEDYIYKLLKKEESRLAKEDK